MNKNLKGKLQPYISRILLIGVLLLMVIILTYISPFFLTWRNIRNILDQTSLYIILSIGMTFVICAGGIDLSVGSVIALSAVTMAASIKGGMSVGIGILLGLAVGILVGIINGVIVSFAKINPFIVTLSTMSIVRGATVLITDGKPIYGFPKTFTAWGSGAVGPFNWPIIISFTMAIIGVIILEKTRLGNYTLVLGCNEEALRRTGVNTEKYKIMIYTLCGLCAAIAGFIISARLNTAEPLAGMGYEMDAIAAVVLGGTDMRGGRGSVSGTVIACLVLGVMRNGLTILSISSNYQQLLTGIIILLTVSISEIKRKNRIKSS